MAIMDSMIRKKYQELKGVTRKIHRIQEFLVQMMDESGQIREKCFGIRYVAEEEKKEKISIPNVKQWDDFRKSINC